MSVGLRDSKGRDLILDPEFSISWEVEDDLFDFDRLGQAYSWTISIPIKGNESTFNYASEVANSKNRFKLYEGFAITVNGNVWWQCSLDLFEVTDDGRYYNANLTSVTSSFFDNKSKKISTLITEKIALADDNYATVIGAINNLASSNIRFPFVHFHNDNTAMPIDGDVILSIDADFKNEPVVNRSAYFLMPAFKLSYLLQLCIDSIGMNLVLDNTDDELDELIVMSNRLIDQQKSSLGLDTYFANINNQLEVSNHVPDITLAELIKDYMFYTGKNVTIEDNTIVFTRIDRMVSSKGAVLDLGNKHSDRIIAKKNVVNGICIEYDYSDDITKADVLPAGTYQGVVTNKISIPGTASVGDYYFVKELNRYLIAVDVIGNDTIHYKNNGHPYSTLELGSNEDCLKWKPTILPAATKDKFEFKVIESECAVTNNGSGKVRITGDFATIATSTKIGWVREDEPDGQIDLLFVGPSVVSSSSGSIDLNSDYLANFKISKLIIGTPINYVVPIIQEDIYYPEIGYDRGKNFKGRIMFWRGMINGTDGTPYPFASADTYSVNGADLGSYSLDTKSTSKVYSIWNTIYQFLVGARIIKMETFLDAATIHRLSRKKLKHIKGLMLFKSISCRITSKGIRDQEIEGYRL
jgi:hypothetical protein